VKKRFFFTHFTFFHSREKTKLHVRKNKTIFVARAKVARFLTRAPTPSPALLRKRPFLVTRKKMREKKLLCF
jgi:hypothetical protein